MCPENRARYTRTSADAFCDAARTASRSDNTINDSEKWMLADMMGRLPTTEQQGRALDYLATSDFPSTYASCSRTADSNSKTSFAAFSSALRSALNSNNQIADTEKQMLADVVRRLPTCEDQGRALDLLATSRCPMTFIACSNVADSRSRTSVSAFRSAAVAAANHNNGIDDTEKYMLVEVFKRLPTRQAQQEALDFLLTQNYPNTYNACAAVAS